MNTLTQQVARCIEREHLATKEQFIYVAVSGGADSVALLTVLHSLGYRLGVLHCNFHLRGEESDRDEAFVRHLSEQLSIPCEVKHFSTQSYAEEQRVSIEMAARELRYAWFREKSQTNANICIAIAHNSDDVVETFLYNLVQGTGIRGLAGMPYKRDGGIIRPMLDCTRTEVLSYLESLGLEQTHCEDSSNSDIRYKRNYIRHRLLPSFEGLKADAKRQINTSIKHLRGAEAYYRESIERYKAKVLDDRGICIKHLGEVPDMLTLLYEILKDYGFTSTQCYQIVEHLEDMPLGANYQSATHQLIYSWGYLEILSRREMDNTYTPIYIELERVPYSISLSGGRVLELSLQKQAVIHREDTLCLPLSLLRTKQLCLRPPVEGERMRPFGLKGNKRISRIFIDAKASHKTRKSAMVLSLGNEILWLLGFSKSEATRIKPGQDSGSHLQLQIISE